MRLVTYVAGKAVGSGKTANFTEVSGQTLSTSFYGTSPRVLFAMGRDGRLFRRPIPIQADRLYLPNRTRLCVEYIYVHCVHLRHPFIQVRDIRAAVAF